MRQASFRIERDLQLSQQRQADVQAIRAWDEPDFGIGNSQRPDHGDAAQVPGGALDALGSLLQVEKCAPAGWAGDKLGLDRSRAGSLEDVEGQGDTLVSGTAPMYLDALTYSVTEQ